LSPAALVFFEDAKLMINQLFILPSFCKEKKGTVKKNCSMRNQKGDSQKKTSKEKREQGKKGDSQKNTPLRLTAWGSVC